MIGGWPALPLADTILTEAAPVFAGFEGRGFLLHELCGLNSGLLSRVAHPLRFLQRVGIPESLEADTIIATRTPRS